MTIFYPVVETSFHIFWMAVSGETCFLSPEQCNYHIDQQGQTTYTNHPKPGPEH